MSKHLVAIVALLLATLGPATAETDAELAQLRAALLDRFPDAVPEHLAPAPLPGLYEVVIKGNLLYFTPDGAYALRGTLFDLENRRDLSDPVLAKVRLERLATMPESKMIIFEPEGVTRHTITTFTDADCPYCRRMHAEIQALLDGGIRVRYLLYPRTGVDSESYRKAVSVWCASDRNEELTLAKNGIDPQPRSCDSPVAEHVELANELGLTGTPMSVTDTGERIMGYVPAAELIARLDAAAPLAQR
jgi:thiol:disulfide interchange protein DsbC